MTPLLANRAVPTRIVAVDIRCCALPLPHPIFIGSARIEEREYAVVRVRSDRGHEGFAIGYTRGLPVIAALEQLAPALLGCDATRPAAVASGLRTSPLGVTGELARALSLIDIGLWDLLAKVSGLPLWRLLGGARERVELLAVAGYFFEQRSVEDVIAEIEQLIGEGFRHVKVPITDRETLLALRAAVGDRVNLSVDAHGGWTNLADARRHCAAIDDLGLAFIEDPLPPARRRLLAELAEHVRTPLAAGEETSGLDDLRDALEGAAVLRLDATSSGGLTTVIEAAAIGKAAGRLVMTHAFPDFHAHLAGGIDAVALVEMIPYRSGPNPVDRLMSSCQPIQNGHLLLSEAPGHGMQLDWDAVERHTTATATITAASGKEANAARGV